MTRSAGRGTAHVVRAVAVLAAATALTACVERTMVIRSNPGGARLLLDDEVVEGQTPVEVPFSWGGTRHVTLMAQGYKVHEGTAVVEDPWFTRFPMDLFTDFLWPGTFYDTQIFDFELEPYHPVDQPFSDAQLAEIDRRMESLKGRAAAARRSDGTAAGAAPRAEAAPPPPPPPPPQGGSDTPPPPPPPPPMNGGR